MKKILVLSDSHGYDDDMMAVIKRELPFDALIHLGDVEGSERKIRDMIPYPAYIVAGNCDYFTDLPEALAVEVGGHRFLLTHGHHFGVNSGKYTLLSTCARENHCDTAVFGHIHRPVDDMDQGVRILNPGSISRPRQANRRGSYMVLTVEEGKEIAAEVKYL